MSRIYDLLLLFAAGVALRFPTFAAELIAVRILLIDNYDSFTWNLHHALEREGAVVDVHRNDRVVPAGIVGYDGVVLSPGPGIPSEAGQTLNALAVAAAQAVPVLGVCLGMQAMAVAFGGALKPLDSVLHGCATPLTASTEPFLFEGIALPTPVGHYHSWVVDEEDFPAALAITARNASGLPMALRHRALPHVGVQFHPESVLTPEGPAMLANWLAEVEAYRAMHPARPASVPVWKVDDPD